MARGYTPRSDQIEMEKRINRIAALLAKGARRSDCITFSIEKWGVGEGAALKYIRAARQRIHDDWSEVERAQMIAEVLSRYATLEMEARRTGQLHVALGCIHGASKVAKLIT
jgi:hypothetical protein